MATKVYQKAMTSMCSTVEHVEPTGHHRVWARVWSLGGTEASIASYTKGRSMDAVTWERFLNFGNGCWMAFPARLTSAPAVKPLSLILTIPLIPWPHSPWIALCLPLATALLKTEYTVLCFLSCISLSPRCELFNILFGHVRPPWAV